MLLIRPDQKGVFSQLTLARFENRMVVHLRKCFPDLFEHLGETEVRCGIRDAVKEGSDYGIILERDVCRYTDLRFLWGRGFDRDPRMPWAAETLGNRALDGSAKVEQLWQMTDAELRRRAGGPPKA